MCSDVNYFCALTSCQRGTAAAVQAPEQERNLSSIEQIFDIPHTWFGALVPAWLASDFPCKRRAAIPVTSTEASATAARHAGRCRAPRPQSRVAMRHANHSRSHLGAAGGRALDRAVDRLQQFVRVERLG